jgi:hypothetical protein
VTSITWSTPRPPVSAHALVPRRRRPVVGAERPQARGLRFAARGRDHAPAEHLGELRCECRDRGARQRRRLLEREVIRDADERVLVKERVLGEHPVERSAELRGVLDAEGAVDPAREDRGGDTVAHGDAADVLAYGDDVPRSVGNRDDVRLDRQRVPAAQHHQLAEAVHRQPVDPGAQISV